MGQEQCGALVALELEGLGSPVGGSGVICTNANDYRDISNDNSEVKKDPIGFHFHPSVPEPY